MIEIENTLCEISVVNVTPVFQIEIELWCAASILRTVNNGVYICTRSVRSDEYMCNTKYLVAYNSKFKPLHK